MMFSCCFWQGAPSQPQWMGMVCVKDCQVCGKLAGLVDTELAAAASCNSRASTDKNLY